VPSSPAKVASTAEVPAFSRRVLQELLWEDAGLVRDAAGLERAASTIAAWRRAQRAPVTEAEFEDENLLLVGEHLVAAACRRRESVGAHYRSDEPAAAEPAHSGEEREHSREDAGVRAPSGVA
jgi:L-aspartate oxidase